MRPWMSLVVVLSPALLGGLTSGCKKPDAAADAGPPEASVPEAAAPEAVATDASTDDAATAAPDAAVKTTTATPTGPTNPFAAGEVWSGNYVCQGTGELTLRITRVSGNSVSAINEFKHHAGKTGSFNMSGTYSPATRQLALQAGSWIKQPPNFSTTNLDGIVSADNHTLAGRVIGASCSSFNVHR